MNKKQLIVTFVIGILLLSGCATIGGINKSYESVNYSDGIDGKEAKVIAQKKLLLEHFSHNYMISTPDIKKMDKYWSVAFLFEPTTLPSSEYFQTFYRVSIDCKTGDVLDSGIHKGTKMMWGFRLHDPEM